MSLLLLKTRDLTWQDHTLNTEVMLAPARSGLLLNKHKTLGAKCQMDKQLYERQRAQCIKDFLSSRRLIDRQRQKLLHRQRELGSKQPRVHSAVEGGGADKGRDKARGEEEKGGGAKERSASAPSATRHGLPAIYIDTGATSPDDSDSSSFFVTEPSGDIPVSSFPVPTRIPLGSTRPGFGRHPAFPGRPLAKPGTPHTDRPALRQRTPTRTRTPPSRTLDNKSPSRVPSAQSRRASCYTLGGARDSLASGDARQPHSVRFADTAPSEAASEALGGKESLKDASLEAKVRVFVEDISQFTLARRLGQTARERPELWPGSPERRRKESSTPLVAKRYNSWNVDQAALLAAFDQFCNVQTPEELAKVVRLASKLKAGVKITRNQSIVPSVATFKTTRAFKSLINR